jgi:hypothetical protein
MVSPPLGPSIEALTAGISFMAREAALEKAPMKPSLVPVFLRISSL